MQKAKQGLVDLDNEETAAYGLGDGGYWNNQDKRYSQGMQNAYGNIGDGLKAEQARKAASYNKGMSHALGGSEKANTPNMASEDSDSRNDYYNEQINRAADDYLNEWGGKDTAEAKEAWAAYGEQVDGIVEQRDAYNRAAMGVDTSAVQGGGGDKGVSLSADGMQPMFPGLDDDEDALGEEEKPITPTQGTLDDMFFAGGEGAPESVESRDEALGSYLDDMFNDGGNWDPEVGESAVDDNGNEAEDISNVENPNVDEDGNSVLEYISEDVGNLIDAGDTVFSINGIEHNAGDTVFSINGIEHDSAVIKWPDEFDGIAKGFELADTLTTIFETAKTAQGISEIATVQDMVFVNDRQNVALAIFFMEEKGLSAEEAANLIPLYPIVTSDDYNMNYIEAAEVYRGYIAEAIENGWSNTFDNFGSGGTIGSGISNLNQRKLVEALETGVDIMEYCSPPFISSYYTAYGQLTQHIAMNSNFESMTLFGGMGK